MRILAIGITVAIAAGLGACDKTTSPTAETPIDCTATMSASPPTATIHPGDTLRVHASAPPCPPEILSPTFWWRAIDTSVAGVDSVAGLVRAKTAGQTTIVGTETVNSQAKVAVALTVAP